MKTTPLSTRCLLAAIVSFKAAVVSGADLHLRAEPLKAVYNDVEPIYIKLTVENRSDKPKEIVLGERLLENILVWTDVDKTKKRNERLKEGGTYTSRTVIKLGPHDKFDTILLVNEWLPLGIGKHKLNVAIKGEGEIVAAVEVAISHMSDAETESALEHLIVKMSKTTDPYARDLYRRGLKKACQETKGKEMLIRLKGRLQQKDILAIVQDILTNYNKKIYD